MQDLNLNSLIQNSLRPLTIPVLKQATNQVCGFTGSFKLPWKMVRTFLILDLGSCKETFN